MLLYKLLVIGVRTRDGGKREIVYKVINSSATLHNALSGYSLDPLSKRDMTMDGALEALKNITVPLLSGEVVYKEMAPVAYEPFTACFRLTKMTGYTTDERKRIQNWVNETLELVTCEFKKRGYDLVEKRV